MIDAPAVSDTNRYIQSLRVNGRPWHKLSLPHSLLASGATLDFVMGPQPSHWGAAPEDSPPSLTTHGRPQPWTDISGSGNARSQPALPQLAALGDNDSTTAASLPAAMTHIDWHFSQPRRVELLTLTSAAHGTAPGSWQLQGSRDGRHWQPLDRRHDQRFRWPLQTRAFALKTPHAYSWYRLSFAASSTTRALGEIELLGPKTGTTGRLSPPSR